MMQFVWASNIRLCCVCGHLTTGWWPLEQEDHTCRAPR